jgi:hypothetical protein
MHSSATRPANRTRPANGPLWTFAPKGRNRPLTTPRDSPVSIFGQGADGQRNGHSLSHHSRCFRTQRSKFHNCCIAAPLMSRLPQQGGATRSIQALSLPNIFRVRLTIFHNGKGY